MIVDRIGHPIDVVKFAHSFLCDEELAASYTFGVERVFLRDLEPLQYATMSVYPPLFPCTQSDWRTWLTEENVNCEDKYNWCGLLTTWEPCPVWEDMVISFQKDADGKDFFTIWDGHHRFAAASIRGMKSLMLVVGRKV